ncbi:MAG: hypothetical protein HQL60_01105 [Magnetococcales bacterium]|nr:hypothetical protein [Magnetococcales bacterium]
METRSDGTLKSQSYALVKATVACLTGDSTSLDFAVLQASAWIDQAGNYLQRYRERFQATQRRFAWIQFNRTLRDVKDATNKQQQPGLIRRSSHHLAESFKLAMQDYALLGQSLTKPFVVEKQASNDLIIVENSQRQPAARSVVPQKSVLILENELPQVTPRDPLGGRTSFHTPWEINNDRSQRADINQSPLALIKARAQAQAQGQLPSYAAASPAPKLLGQAAPTATRQMLTSGPTIANGRAPAAPRLANRTPATAAAPIGNVRTFLEPVKTAAADVSGSFASDRYASVHHFKRVLQQRPSQRRAIS